MILPGWSLAELEAAMLIAVDRRGAARRSGDEVVVERQTSWLDRLLDAVIERTGR